MQTDVAAVAVTFADRGSSHDNNTAEPPKKQPAEQPRRRRRRWFGHLLGGAFLDGPNSGPNSGGWQGACGQGG